MEGSTTSSINSRASAIKATLLEAWRGKLSNEEWEIRIRKILPKNVNGDVYDLADCLLRQALVGTVPNQLFISYTRHAIEFELVSHGAVLCSIAHQPTNIRPSNSTPNRSPSIICLLKFLKTFRDKISCKGTELECLNLCHSLCQLIHWLAKCVLNSLEAIIGSPPTVISNNTNATATTSTPTALSSSLSNVVINSINNNNNNTLANNFTPTNINNSSGLINESSIVDIIDRCTEAINYFINKPFTKSLLFISKVEFRKEFDEILTTVKQIKQKFDACPNLQSLQDKIPHLNALENIKKILDSHEMHPSVMAAQQLRCLQMHRIRSTHISSGNNLEKKAQQSITIQDSRINYSLFNALYPLIAFDVILRPARSHKPLARQIATVTNFNSAPVCMTYCELIRACMIGMIDAEGTPFKKKWTFFTLLKMPKLLIELSKVIKNGPESTNPADNFASYGTQIFISDLKQAFERLCEYSPLIDQAEYNNNCDFFKCLVNQLIKNDSGLIHLKSIDFRKLPPKLNVVHHNDGSTGAYMILKTEPVVKSMLGTFDLSQDKVQLFGTISQLVSGKQFELTLSVAASTGALQTFFEKLVEHNELNRLSKVGESTKEPLAQPLIFDMTFLILAYIAQQYGSEVVGTNSNSTFHKWYYDCYHPGTRFNCPKEMIKDCDQEVVSSLLRQILKPDGAINMYPKDWNEVIFCMPRVMHEIVLAWNQGQLSDEEVMVAVERIRSKMCLMAVTAATWLQCYIKTVNDTMKSKPLLLLQSMTKASPQARMQKQSTESTLKSESYTERSSLMCSIIRKIYFEITPKCNTGSSSPGNSGCNINSVSVVSNNTNSTISALSSNNNVVNETEESLNESSYQSINDRFISTLSSEEIFLANVKQCLARGWIDHKSLNSLNCLFKMIGSECFTNQIVEQILTSQESPSDLSRAVNITYGLFHMDIEACALALLKDTIPSWLMGEKKQALLNQPRAFALAHLSVMTIIEVYNNLKSSQNKSTSLAADDRRPPILPMNGIKQEPGLQPDRSSINGPEIKRAKFLPIMPTSTNTSSTNTNDIISVPGAGESNITERLERLNSCIVDLMRLFREIMSDPVISQRTLFPLLFLQQTVICSRENSSLITAHLQSEIVLDIIKLFSSELTFELVLAISNLSNNVSRRFTAKAMCQLAQAKELKQQQQQAQSQAASGGNSTAGSKSSPIGGSNSGGTNSSSTALPGGQSFVASAAGGPANTQKSASIEHVPMIIG